MDQQKITGLKRRNRKVNVKKNILNFVVFCLMILTIFSFLRWLYHNEATAVFNDGQVTQAQFDAYESNPFVQIINQAVPSAKTCYEKRYGRSMPGLIYSVFRQATGISYTDLGKPITYLNIVFSAFGQGHNTTPASSAIASDNKNAQLPDIKDFNEAPEGAIYFDEEDHDTTEDIKTNDPAATDPSAENITQPDEDELSPPEKLALEKKAPQILIYHTHATESYMPNVSSNYHTLTEKYNVVSVGNAMTKALQNKYKYKVIHDKTYHDKESYVYSYTNSLLTVRKNVAANKSIKVILDVHRDAFATSSERDKNVRKDAYTTLVNGKKAARVMLVVGGKNPNYKELEKFAVYIKKKMEKLYPGLFFKIDRKPNSKYNQYYSDYSMLIEVGCMLNTDEEANYSGELVGNVIGEVLKDLRE